MRPAILVTVAAMTVAALAAPGLVAGPARAAAHGGSCLYVNQITGTKAGGMRIVYARVGHNAVWRLDLKSDCAPLGDGGGEIILQPVGSGSICGPQEVNLSVAAAGGSQRCFVGAMTRLTPEEAAALPAQVQP